MSFSRNVMTLSIINNGIVPHVYCFLKMSSILGNIIVGKKLDREKKSSYTLNVTVSDGINLISTQVVIKLTDVNDNPPKFRDSIVTVTVVEENYNYNDTYPRLIYTLNATDQDEGDNKDIYYTSGILKYYLIFLCIKCIKQ